MIQSGRRSRLEHEAVYCIGMKYSPPREELQDQIATELGIASLVELTHSTRTEEADDLVFADRGPGGHGLGGVHRTKNIKGYPIPDTRYPIPDARYPMPDARCPTSDVRRNRLPVTGYR